MNNVDYEYLPRVRPGECLCVCMHVCVKCVSTCVYVFNEANDYGYWLMPKKLVRIHPVICAVASSLIGQKIGFRLSSENSLAN